MGRKQRRTQESRSFRQLDLGHRRRDALVVDGVTCRSGKTPYRSRAAARKALLTLRNAPSYVDTGRPMHVYQCPACGHWHFGHSSRRDGDR